VKIARKMGEVQAKPTFFKGNRVGRRVPNSSGDGMDGQQ
jgi:hypothetical protein